MKFPWLLVAVDEYGDFPKIGAITKNLIFCRFFPRLLLLDVMIFSFVYKRIQRKTCMLIFCYICLVYIENFKKGQ